MNKYFTIILATVITSLAVTSSANARIFGNDGRIFDGDGRIFDRKPPSSGGGCSVSEPAAAMVALTALGVFVAARRRKSV